MAGPPAPPDSRLFGIMADGSRAITWGDMTKTRGRVAHSLARRLSAGGGGLGDGSATAAAIYGKNSVEWVLSLQVIQALGLRFSPINWHLAPEEIAYIVDDCDAGIVFYGSEFADTLGPIGKKAPKVEIWVCMDIDATSVSVPSLPSAALSLWALAREAPEGATPPKHSRAGGTVSYTGGTTGRPKGAVRTTLPQLPPEVRMKQLGEWGMLRMNPEPVQLQSAPLYHAMPMAFYTLGNVLGHTFIFMPKFDAVGALAAIEKFKVRGFYMPPILLKRLLKVPVSDRKRFDLSSVSAVLTGGAPCPTSVKEGIVQVFGPVLHEIYGASELGGVAAMPPEFMLKKPLSCGRPAAGIEVILLDNKRQRITTPGVPGEIFSKGLNVDGYHKQPGKTQEAKFGDFFSVGDVGYFDEDGFLYISDRKTDMVISGGANIYPVQVEEVIHQHPDVEDVAVFGVPDEEYGERVHAAVRLVDGRSLTAAELLAWCSGKVGKFQLPREGEITFYGEDFPRSEAGKVRKKVLKERVLSSRQAAGAAPPSRRSRL